MCLPPILFYEVCLVLVSLRVSSWSRNRPKTVCLTHLFAAFPLFTTPMFKNLGIHWAVAVPAGLALICLPFPFVFYKYGPAIRARCKYTKKAEEVLKMMMAGNPESKAAPAETESDREEREVDREENEGVEEAENDINASNAGHRSQSFSSRQSDSENTLASQNGIRKASK